MTAPSVIASGVGFRNLRVFALDANGYIAAPDENAYEGVLVSGVKNFTVNDPEPRLITHLGDDAPFALDILPPTEAITGSVSVAKQNDTLDAALTGLMSYQVGEMNLFNLGTDKRGFENTVGAIAYRQTLDTDPTSSEFGARRWQFKILPKVTFFPLESGYSEAPEERAYTVRPSFITEHIWGTAIDLATEGCNRAQLVRGISQFKPKIVAFRGDAVTENFLFPTADPAQSDTKTSVWRNGALQAGSYIWDATGITFTVAPDDGDNITVFYETD